MKIEISDQQLKNLEAFLGRVDLKWSEVPAFNDLIKALSTPIKEDLTTNPKTNGTK